MNPFELVRERLEAHGCNPRGTGDKFEFCCPLHGDRAASAGASVGADGRVLILCQVCGRERTEEILAAIGLGFRDLYPHDGIKPELIRVYDYLDERGELLFEVGRFEPGFKGERKSFLQRRPGRSDWKGGIKGVRRVLYRLPRVVEAVKAGQRVWVVEGEEDVHALEQRGEVATCNPMGAGRGKWLPEFSEVLRGATVALIADRDKPGRKHALAIVRSLEEVGATVKIGEAADGNDTRDHLAVGHGIHDFKPVPLAVLKSAEHTEQSAKTPVNTRDTCSVGGANTDRTPTEHTPEPERPQLARDPRILDRFDEKMGELGLIGERHIARAVYLVHVSRRLPVPGRQVTKGDSSTGKSYAAECALEAAAPEFLYVRTSTSALALFYTEQDLRHHTLVFYEANKLGDEDDDFARVVRTLLSENKLKHEVTDAKKMKTVLLEKEGPVAFISTVAKPTLDPEVETRILSLYSDGSDEQTARVVEALLQASENPRDAPDFTEWHALDRWIASFPPADVIVPWGSALASFKLSGPPRLRRDITNLLGLAKAHALLHRATREVDSRARVIATLDDYEVVHELLSKALAIATDKAVRSGTREIVEAVVALKATGEKTVSMRAASRKAGRSPSTTHTDVHDALDRGYLLNRSQRDRSYDLDVGDPLPSQEELLPSRAELEARFDADCSVGVRSTVRSPTEHENPVDTGDFEECSVCSADLEVDGQSGPRLEDWRAELPDDWREHLDRETGQ